MTQLDEAWLERAREALSPREADQARVLAALEQRLQLPSHAAKHEHEHDHDHDHDQRRSNSLELDAGPKLKKLGWPKPNALWRWALRALVPLAGVAAISFLVTTRSTPPTASSAKRQAQKPVAAAVTQASLPDALDLALAQAAEVKVSSDARTPKPAQRPQSPTDTDTAPSEKKPARKKCRAANGSERPCTTSRPTPTALALVNAAPPTAAAPASSLSQELAALREAQRALRNGQPAQALEVLTAFERTATSPGVMQEERNAAATMARCALSVRDNPQSRSELYDGFVRRYPNSAYAARLSRICQPK